MVPAPADITPCLEPRGELAGSAGGAEVRRTIAILVGIAALAVSGCSSISTTFDYDRNADFSKFETFAWMPTDNSAVANAQQAQLQNDLFTQRLRRAVNANLESKGYSINTEDPDFVVVYHLGVQDKVNVTNWGYTYGPYWGPWGQSVDVTHYTEGTLIIDFISWETKELIWRGTAQKALTTTPDPNRVEERVKEVVDKTLLNFPPPEK